MKFLRLQFAAAAAAVILLGMFSRDAQPQPPRTIKIVVPLAPGGGADILTRLLADHIRRIEAVGWTSHTWTRTSRWRAPKRSSIARTMCSKYSNDASRAKPNMPGDR